MQEIENKLKVNKWWYFIPIIGNIIYSTVFEWYLSNRYIKDDSFKRPRKIIKKYKSFFNLGSLLITLPFLIYGIVTKGDRDFWNYWPFITLMSIGGFSNLTPLISWYLYRVGYKKYILSERKNISIN